LDQLAFVPEEFRRVLVGLDGQLWLIHPAVCFAQPEPLGHVLGLQGDELLEDFGRLLPPRLLEVLGDLVLQPADVDLRLFRHPPPFWPCLRGLVRFSAGCGGRGASYPLGSATHGRAAGRGALPAHDGRSPRPSFPPGRAATALPRESVRALRRVACPPPRCRRSPPGAASAQARPPLPSAS